MVLGVLLALACATVPQAAGQPQAGTGGAAAVVPVSQASIGGTVVNVSGSAEAGVWVIAETLLPVPFRKIVVTDDQGRFLVPDLPAGDYNVWVRGYGLVDSEKVPAQRGGRVRLEVGDATPLEAAKNYPAAYWAALIEPPANEVLPEGYTTQEEWLAGFRTHCGQCHQVGMPISRLYSTEAQWEQVLQRNRGMSARADLLGRDFLKKTLVDWVKRIQDGAVPPAPPRPTGVERNFVVSQWEWGDRNAFIHDVTSTDKRNPTMYPYGKIYAADRTTGGRLWEFDPKTNEVAVHELVPRTMEGFDPTIDYYRNNSGPERWMTSPHNPMFDENGRVWLTQTIRPRADMPSWTRSALVPQTSNPEELELAHDLRMSRGNAMQLGFFDTQSETFSTVDTVYPTHHLQFDWEGKLWTNTNGNDVVAIGVLDTKQLDYDNIEATEGAAQKGFVRVDLSAGEIGSNGGYGVAISPVDGAIWQGVPGVSGEKNKLLKFDPETETITDYALPAPGRVSHGTDFSTDGMLWFSAGSGHLGRLDPETEQFTYWELPGPKWPGTGQETGSIEYPYYLWVDQFNALGMGENMVVVTGTISDSLLIFDPGTEEFTTFRLPYPLVFYTRGLDGRIDDASAGWKGRGLWASYSSYVPRYSETGMGHLNHIQIRPNPLAE